MCNDKKFSQGVLNIEIYFSNRLYANPLKILICKLFCNGCLSRSLEILPKLHSCTNIYQEGFYYILITFLWKRWNIPTTRNKFFLHNCENYRRNYFTRINCAFSKIISQILMFLYFPLGTFNNLQLDQSQ